MIIVGGSDRLLNGLDLGSIAIMIIAVIKRKRADRYSGCRFAAWMENSDDSRLVRISVRRIKVAIASACPWQDEFVLAHLRLALAAA